MRSRRVVEAGLALLLAGPPAGAAAPFGPLNLSALIDEAMQRNPEVLRAQQSWEAAKARPPQVRALPDPTLQLELQNVGATGLTLGRAEMSMAGVGLSQSIPYPGKRRLREQVAQAEAQTAAATLEATRNAVATRLKTAYFDLAAGYATLDVVERTRTLLEEFEATARSRYSVGEGNQQDVLKAQVELSVLAGRTAVLEQQRRALEATLNGLLDRPPGSELGRPGDLAAPDSLPPVEVLDRWATDHSPELRARRRESDAAALRVRQMQREYAPDFALSAAWKSRGRFDDVYQLMLETELPRQRERRRWGVVEAQASLQAARLGERASETSLAAGRRELAAAAQAAARQAQLYQDAVLPQARFSLESAVAGYRVGKVDFLTLLDNARVLLDTEVTVQEQLAEYHRSVARLEELVGVPLGQRRED